MMANNSSNSSTWTNNSSSVENGDIFDLPLMITFGFISITSIVPNILFLLALLLSSDEIRKRCHNILLYNLMITDALAGVAIAVTPNLIVPESSIKHPDGFSGELYCRLLVSEFIVFLLGVASVYTVVFLSIERWLAVKHPIKYRNSHSPIKMKICLVIIWFIALIANAPHLLEISSSNEQNADAYCKWRSGKSQTRNVVAVFEFLVKFLIPTVILLLVLISLHQEFRKPTNIDCQNGEQRNSKLLRICALTSIAVLLCWSPNQIYYTLFKFDSVQLGTDLHHFTIVLAISTSSINPFIYFLTSKTYRKCLLNFLNRVFGKCKKRPVRRLSTSIPMETSNMTSSIG